MSRKLESIHALALHASTPEAEWQAAAIAYFRILRAGKKEKPEGIRMDAPGFGGMKPYYPFGGSQARADAAARAQHEYFRSAEYQERRRDEMDAERARRDAEQRARRQQATEEFFARHLEIKRAFSERFQKKWGVPPSETHTHNVGQIDPDTAEQDISRIYEQANKKD